MTGVANQLTIKSNIIHMGTHEDHPISSLHTCLCSARLIVNAQVTKHASTQCVCKSHPGFQGEQLVQ